MLSRQNLENLGCVPLAVSFSGFHSGRCMIVVQMNGRVGKQPVVGDLFFIGLWIVGNCCRGEQVENKPINIKIYQYIFFMLYTCIEIFSCYILTIITDIILPIISQSMSVKCSIIRRVPTVGQ